MKKLMIATAAIALGTSGVYATEGCCGTAASESETCKANVYEVKMNLKTLVTKKVTKNGCVGYYYDQGTRTINGYIWTCCDPCANLDNTEDYQITLWDKAAQVGILKGVGKGTGSSSDKYTVTVTYTTVGGGTTQFTDTLPDEYAQDDIAQAVTDFLSDKGGTIVGNPIATKVGSGSTSIFWADTDLGADIFRVGKTAEKVAVEFEADGGDYYFLAAGFGTFDKKSMVIKSISGNVVGTVPTLDLCDEYGAYTYLCDDTFETWCDYVGEQIVAPAYGTWTAKYVKKMSKSLKDTVPSYDRQ